MGVSAGLGFMFYVLRYDTMKTLYRPAQEVDEKLTIKYIHGFEMKGIYDMVVITGIIQSQGKIPSWILESIQMP